MSAFSRRNVGSQWNLGSERRDRQSKTTNWNRNDWKTELSYGLSLIFDEALSHNICRRTIIKPLQMSETSSATVSYAIPPHITRQIYALQIWNIIDLLNLMIYPSLSDRPLVCEICRIVYIQSRYDATIMMIICVQCNLHDGDGLSADGTKDEVKYHSRSGVRTRSQKTSSVQLQTFDDIWGKNNKKGIFKMSLIIVILFWGLV